MLISLQNGIARGKAIALLSLTVAIVGLPSVVLSQEMVGRIEQVVNAGIMSEYPDGQFHPERVLVKAEIAAILVKNFNLDQRRTGQTGAVYVKDVPQNHWAYQYVQTVVRTGVMKLDREGRFQPGEKVTRAAGLTAFAQAYGLFQMTQGEIGRVLDSYRDANQIPDWARVAIATLIFEDLTNIDTASNRIEPLRPMTRGDIAYTLSQYLAKLQNPGTIPSIPLD
ncbi:MAG: S-layer homology domain-containing protein [Oscillatoria sp. SIO1A7]|nr:S-layer homology domain-containing protein [Oscillatoria sp. SIO1A7]